MDYQPSKTKISAFISLFTFIKKYWYWVVLFCFLIPSVIQAISYGLRNDNPSYPLFVLAGHITSADQVLEQKVDSLANEKLNEMVGAEKPTEGIWNAVVWHWKWFWSVPFVLLSLVYTIFLPAVFIYKIVKFKKLESDWQNILTAGMWFLLYLIVTNSAILIYGMIEGNQYIVIPDKTEKFKTLGIILFEMLPFHGLGKLIVYLFGLVMGTAPPII